MKAAIVFLAACAATAHPTAQRTAGDTISTPSRNTGRLTGLKLPRFVSLKSETARMRVGPSTDYPVRFVYMVAGLPMELIEEWGNWRLVRDHDGSSGWMHAALLSGQRTAIIAPWLKEGASLRHSPAQNAGITALLQPGVIVKISDCSGSWCHAAIQRPRLSGYVAQTKLWGVYPREVIE
ncbi:SH3 domain-containing protein [Pararhizobium sp. PWRC1-1]|uniref:SH3 domain-containing protein n=1 Tax=Pararhizobium sp. PWRC1-1 TaxID=2804566 RepID=UPI003CF845DE